MIAAVAAIVVCLLIWFANQSVFYPSRYPEGPWHLRSQLGAQDVAITSADGMKLHGWYSAPKAPWVWTLFLHGNAGNVSHRVEAIQAVTQAGSAILVLDYRGYGRSEGRPSETGLYRDAEAGYRYLLQQGVQPGHIVLHGESLGSAVAVNLAARLPCGGVILEAPFTSIRAMAGKVVPVAGPLLVWGFDSESLIGKLRAPLFIVHGDQDTLVPPEMSDRLFAAAPEPKTLWRVSGAGHNNLVDAGGTEYVERLRRFYQTVSR